MLKQCENKMSNSYVLEYYKDEKKLESRGAIILDGALNVVKVRFPLCIFASNPNSLFVSFSSCL